MKTVQICSLLLLVLPVACFSLSSPSPPSSSSAAAAAAVQVTTTTSGANNIRLVQKKTNVLDDFDYMTQDKLPWAPNGYYTYQWWRKDDQDQQQQQQYHDINYIEMGDPSKPALVFIHGFGASCYHWRYNIPILARDYHVFAFCKLGFGLSSKPVQEYPSKVWRDQTVDFLNEVVQKPATLVGNSLGGFTALYTAATTIDDDANKPSSSLVNGVILLNGAGRFRDTTASPNNNNKEKRPNAIVKSIRTTLQRFVIGSSFLITKQPARIQQILKQVYSINDTNVDDVLVESIHYPSLDPNAAEVFYQVITKTSNNSAEPVYIDDLLDQMKNSIPLLLLWGMKDPWIRPATADKIQTLYPTAERVNINAGHCPHDEGEYYYLVAVYSSTPPAIVANSHFCCFLFHSTIGENNKTHQHPKKLTRLFLIS
eukprot:scaffold1767_cov71-Cylindrotheca_fusiformis.AAC.3